MAAESRFVFESYRTALDLAASSEADSIVLLGQTGGGKSSIANALLGMTDQPDIRMRRFPEGEDMISMTGDLNVVESHWFGKPGEEKVVVIDTPGFLDTERRGGKFLAGLVDFLSEFPKNKLRLILITIPLTEIKTNQSYTDMLQLIDGLFRPSDPHQKSLWEHVVFVFTQSNALGPSVNLQMRRDGWEKFIKKTTSLAFPHFCEFRYHDPKSLKPIRIRFDECRPYTPQVTEQMAAFIRENPHADLQSRIDHHAELKKMQAKFEEDLKVLVDKKNQLVERLTREQSNSETTQRRLDAAISEQKRLNDQLEQMRNRPPTIVYVPPSGCLCGSSIVEVKEADGRVVSRQIRELREGQVVRSVDDGGRLCWSEVYFVDGVKAATPMVQIGCGGRSARLTAEHLIYVDRPEGGRQASAARCRPVVARAVRVGDVVFAAGEGEAGEGEEVEARRVTDVGSFASADQWTVLVRQHRLLVDSVLVSSHVIDQDWGIADNAVMLFLYDHVSPAFVASPFNKSFCRAWDAFWEPVAMFFRDINH